MRCIWFKVRARRSLAIVAVAALNVAAGGCAMAPSVPYAGPDPADAGVPVRAVSWRSAVAGYDSWRPVEPAPWRDRNDRVAPLPR